MSLEIWKSILMSISFLVLVAYLITKTQIVKRYITQENDALSVKLAMAVVFGAVGIISTYLGAPVNGAIANTRVIGVIAGGILGGPLVGIVAGMIAGFHRYLSDIGGFTAVACAISTIMEGAVGGIYFHFVKRRKNDIYSVFFVTVAAEILQMLVILLLARPFDAALELVKIISIPMVLFNSAGTALFVSVFDSVFIEKDKEAADQVRLVLDIADRCLPILRHGLIGNRHLEKALKILLDESRISGAALTDGVTVLSASGYGLSAGAPLPEVCRRTMKTGSIQTMESTGDEDPLREALKTRSAVCAPLTQKDGEAVGTLLVLVRKYRLTHEVEYVFVGGLARLFSTQLELSQLDYQKKLLQKAEFTALQSQINPHFLFNALSTITAFCREKPERARELLIVLSNYFRNTLQTGDYMISLRQELEHVKAYLELEKARFEDKLTVEIELSDDLLECTVPSFILQPIVENAVKHGAMGTGKAGRVIICAHNTSKGTEIAVTDNGAGIPPEVIDCLKHNEAMNACSVGMLNVHRRLKSIYGADNGLVIGTVPVGTRISMVIPYGAAHRLGGAAS